MKELLQKLHDAAMQAILETEDVDSLETWRPRTWTPWRACG